MLTDLRHSLRKANRQAREDGALHPDEELAQFKPFEESDQPESFKQVVRRRGRRAWTKALKKWIAEHGSTEPHS